MNLLLDFVFVCPSNFLLIMPVLLIYICLQLTILLRYEYLIALTMSNSQLYLSLVIYIYMLIDNLQVLLVDGSLLYIRHAPLPLLAM